MHMITDLPIARVALTADRSAVIRISAVLGALALDELQLNRQQSD